MEVDLGGQVALVSGAGSGIRQAIAQRLIADGAQVAETGEAGVPRDPAEADAAVAQVLDRFGRLDILVHCAGRADDDGTALEELSSDAWRRALDAEPTGAFLCARAAARAMLARGYGRIVLVGSAVGAVPRRRHAAEAVVQAGLVALARAMAIEWSPRGVLANALAAGAVATGDDGLLSHVPLARPATLREIADAALFLVDPENSYLTGHTLVVDGGWTAGYARDF